MTRKWIGLLMLGLLGTPITTLALPTTVGAGEIAGFNFDTGSTGPFQYGGAGWGGSAPADTTFTVYDDLDLQGTVEGSGIFSLVSLGSVLFTAVNDGAFSVAFTSPTTSFTTDFFYVYFVDRDDFGLTVDARDVSSVPEPGTLALLGLGLAGLAAARRRRQ
jgi:hypothetical protein